MRVLVTGATGLIGSAVARRLGRDGHEIAALARSDASAGKLTDAGFEVVRGDLGDAASLVEAAQAVDAVVHAASPNDQNAAACDEAATRTIIDALRGSCKRFVYTSGCLIYGVTGDVLVTEDGPLDPVELVRWRKGLEAEILAATADGVHSIVVRLGWVYGHGCGSAMMMVVQANEHGVARHVGDGRNRWSTVHADDLAELYALALEGAPAGAVYNGVHGKPTPLIEIAHAASEGAGRKGRVSEWPLAEARRALGAFADAIACDQVVSGEKAVRELGWRPSRNSILTELRS